MNTSRIFLIGLMGSGKSYWGRKLAVLLQWKFVDLDHYIEEQEKMSISEIFEKNGEEYFRNLESKYLMEMETLDHVVVATGGGTPCFHNNIESMNRMGETYYLKIKPETAVERVKEQAQLRPLLNGKSPEEMLAFFSWLLEEREPHYSKAAHLIDAENISEEKLKEIFT